MNNNVNHVSFIPPREQVEIILPDQRVISGRRGAPLESFLRLIEPEYQDAPIVGALVNQELRELTYPIQIESRVEPVTMRDEDGMRIYRRSLTFILEAAFEKLYPGASLTIDHSVAAGGYYCQVSGLPALGKEEADRLEAEMRQLVAQDLPLVREQVPLGDAIAYFQEHGYLDKVKLLAHRQKDYLVMYRLENYRDYHHGYMVPSTGYLKWFAVHATDGGFTLQFPRRNSPTVLSALRDYPKMLATFRQYGNWLERLGIDSVGALNDVAASNRMREVILVSEALHEQQIAAMAAQIAAQKDRLRVILIAGPTSSGKTTSSRRLTIQLLAHGISTFPLEMDNYFVNRLDTPLDENGEFDYESLYALDRERLAHDLDHLIHGEQVQLPKYNFRTGLRETGESVQLRPNQMIILEGIHGLNPDLIPGFPQEQTFRIYISALTQLNLDRHNRVSTTDTRLIRRIVRDARERGYDARTTIKRWESVTRGEKRNIFPYQENADVMFNSALVYELSALKPLVEPLLRQVPPGSREYVEAKRLLSLLEWFVPIEDSMIPDNSILREFIGQSILKDFTVWDDVVQAGTPDPLWYI